MAKFVLIAIGIILIAFSHLAKQGQQNWHNVPFFIGGILFMYGLIMKKKKNKNKKE